jgi:hypothetical protein
MVTDSLDIDFEESLHDEDKNASRFGEQRIAEGGGDGEKCDEVEVEAWKKRTRPRERRMGMNNKEVRFNVPGKHDEIQSGTNEAAREDDDDGCEPKQGEMQEEQRKETEMTHIDFNGWKDFLLLA